MNRAIAEVGVEAYAGTVQFIHQLRRDGFKIAVVTSSQNCRAVLKAAKLDDVFKVRVDGNFHPEFLAQLETMLALGNGYLGMRGCPEEGGPYAENGTFINGFYETRPIVYGEDAYGFARTGQTICNVTDSKIIKLFVDDEPFCLYDAHLLRYDRRLNMKSGTLDREILWETPAGKQVSIKSRRLVSLPSRHVAAISYCVTLLNATISGEEASAYYAAGTAQYHINADIMYALRKYVQATGDEAFLRDFGAEMLVETARLWLDLGFYSAAKGGKFCINGVTGPDEYNAVVNNNAYTNLMARENLHYATQVIQSLQATEPDAYKALTHKTALEPSEVSAWIGAAENMYVPYDEKLGIVPQDDEFLEKEPWDFRNTPADHYPLLLFYHPLNIYRKQVIKQADVVLAMFLLGDAFSLEAKKRNFDFYDPLTTGNSSLSSSVEAIIAAQVGDIDKAIRYGMAALLMDLADVGGNVKDGCHIASMGGTWMMLTYGLAGMRDHNGTLSFWPRRAPEDNAILRFPVTYRGQLLEVEISPDKVQYTLREGEHLVIRHETEEVELTREKAQAVRPVSRG